LDFSQDFLRNVGMFMQLKVEFSSLIGYEGQDERDSLIIKHQQMHCCHFTVLDNEVTY
jgi:hypothetical protein